MKSGTVVLLVGGLVVLGGAAFLVLRNRKSALSLSQQSLAAAPPVAGTSRGVASGSGVNNSAPPQNKGYGDKAINTASNLLGLANEGFSFYKKAIA